MLSLEIRDELKQQHGFVHGSVVSHLTDNALTYADDPTLGDSVTVEYKINYLRPAIGERLIARASVLTAGKRQAVCLCEVFALANGEEKRASGAQGTITKAGE